MLAATIFAVSLSAARPAGLRPALEPVFARAPAIAVLQAGKPTVTFWIADVPLTTTAESGAGSASEERVAFPRIPQGTLIGAVRFETPWRDYRDFVVPPGLYTLRYVRQPAIKEHKGVSELRDFMVLTSAAFDDALESASNRAVARSKESFDRGHPVVMAVFPAPISGSPRILENSRGESMLSTTVGGESMGFVLAGHGRIDPP